ncbi:hypothetical protein [Propionicimonas sp.]|uniref:hypothetical protein n=1 Tax=Propionicimonas sp. TaxID=1955623 RepID=UPI0039E3B7DF
MLIFTLGPLLSIIAPLITLPAVSGHFGAAGWASVAVGQSVGGAAAIVVALGWDITGPIELARAPVEARRQVFFRSLAQRLPLAVLTIPVAVLATYLSKLEFPVAGALTAVALSTTGLSASWLYIGLARPVLLVVLDSLPRTLASVAGALLIVNGADLVTLPIVQLLVYCAVAVVPFAVVKGSVHVPRVGRASLAGLWREQGYPLLTRVATSAYVALPTTILALTGVGTASVANYAGVERLARTGLAGLAPVNYALQGWIPTARDQRQLAKRMRVALVVNGAVALLGATLFVLLANPVAGWLFHGEVTLSRSAIVAFTVVIVAVVMSRCTGIQCLATAGRLRVVAFSTIAGFCIAVPLIILGGQLFGADGTAWAVATTEVVVLCIQSVALAGFFRAQRVLPE